jgi:hypothetical protein
MGMPHKNTHLRELVDPLHKQKFYKLAPPNLFHLLVFSAWTVHSFNESISLEWYFFHFESKGEFLYNFCIDFIITFYCRSFVLIYHFVKQKLKGIDRVCVLIVPFFTLTPWFYFWCESNNAFKQTRCGNRTMMIDKAKRSLHALNEFSFFKLVPFSLWKVIRTKR